MVSLWESETAGRRRLHLVRALIITLLAAWVSSAGEPAGAATSSSKKAAFSIPAATKQLIVGVSASWDDSRVTLIRYERADTGDWAQVGNAVPGRIGKSGMAWGRGEHNRAAVQAVPRPKGARSKAEGDGRTPAGVFTLGSAFGYAPEIDRHPDQPYVQVGSRDLMVDDPDSPFYNKYLRLDREPETAWERKQQMDQDDPIRTLQLFINHNTTPVVPGAGSAILFHRWRRDGASATVGCTALPAAELAALVAWINPNDRPLYVVLPRPVYDGFTTSWKLPAIAS
jgi:L,D-peptidoglycan transpeptidase YkuD (ErfK/YbiS/YcfS/YnhG family)